MKEWLDLDMELASNIPILVGGLGVANEFGKQYRQGNRVYNSNNIAMALCAQPLGNLGGYSYLYLVKRNER